jgi:metal-sulfur cluster biosynthetic enzyme
MTAAPTSSPATERVTAAAVRAVLDSIIDPCSAASGSPAGLGEMGLVRELSVVDEATGAVVRVTLAVTHPFCMMAAVFVNEAQIRLLELPGVARAEVGIDGSYLWTEDDFEPQYAQRRRASLIERGLIPVTESLSIAATGDRHPEGANHD